LKNNAKKRKKIARRCKTTAVIENTFGVFEISFGVLHFSAWQLKGKSAVQTGFYRGCKRERMPR
jgi:hypothetical protein